MVCTILYCDTHLYIYIYHATAMYYIPLLPRLVIASHKKSWHKKKPTQINPIPSLRVSATAAPVFCHIIAAAHPHTNIIMHNMFDVTLNRGQCYTHLTRPWNTCAHISCALCYVILCIYVYAMYCTPSLDGNQEKKPRSVEFLLRRTAARKKNTTENRMVSAFDTQ